MRDAKTNVLTLKLTSKNMGFIHAGLTKSLIVKQNGRNKQALCSSSYTLEVQRMKNIMLKVP